MLCLCSHTGYNPMEAHYDAVSTVDMAIGAMKKPRKLGELG